MQGLPPWVRDLGAQKLESETETYRRMTGSERFRSFLAAQELALLQLRASPFGARALALPDPLPSFVAKLFADGAKRRAKAAAE